jgi:two-component system response regulator AlgR
VRILIVDDEAPARERLRRHLASFPDCEAAGEAGSGEEALRLCREAPPDVVLMDIRMPGMGGLEAARVISTMEAAPAVIFTTAYDEYALDAYAAGPADYLVKPVRREHLARALSRAARPTRAQLAALTTGADEAVPATTGATRTSITARTGDRLEVVPLETIVAFCADNKYTNVLHERGEVLIDDSLKSLAHEFGEAFVRIHREALVSRRHVVALERDGSGGYHVRLERGDGGTLCLRVSRRHATAVKRRLRGR